MKGLFDGTDCISTDCQSSVLGENKVDDTAKDSLLLSAIGGDISRPESRALCSRMFSSRMLSSSSKYFCACLVSTVNGCR